MKIENSRTLKTLQEDFQKVFPYLKIEFYKSVHYFGEESPKEDALDPMTLVGDARDMDNYGIMNLEGSQKTSEFERIMTKLYGLNVQVFRKSYGKWLQTWATDNWTLQEQNDRSAKMGDKSFEKPKNLNQKAKDKIF